MTGIDIPDSVDGRSLWPAMRGDARPWEYVHMECAGWSQSLTDGREKYIWDPRSGGEYLFDLDSDPNELHNIAADPGSEPRVAAWRGRLIERLKGRPEGFTDGERLIAGRPVVGALEHAGPGAG